MNELNINLYCKNSIKRSQEKIKTLQEDIQKLEKEISFHNGIMYILVDIIERNQEQS